MQVYVVGFAFNFDDNRVLLIEKNRPAWQRGRLNGIGGHVEPSEAWDPSKAMYREAGEEAGISSVALWEHRGSLINEAWLLHVFRCRWDIEALHNTHVEEGVLKVCRRAVLPASTLPNLRWLIPLVLDDDIPFFQLVDTSEPKGGQP